VEVGPEDDVLISGGGDGTIKLWSLGAQGRTEPDDPERTGIKEIMSLGADDAESVLSLALDGSFLYAGKLDGIVELWDLDTAQRLRVIKAQNQDIMSLQMGWGYLWTTSADGWANVSTHFITLFFSTVSTDKMSCRNLVRRIMESTSTSQELSHKDTSVLANGKRTTVKKRAKSYHLPAQPTRTNNTTSRGPTTTTSAYGISRMRQIRNRRI
jgi:WD40 repeat protein